MTRAPGKQIAAAMLLGTCVLVLTSACGTGSRYDPSEELDDNGPPEQVAVEPVEPAPAAPEPPAPEPVAAWTCSYDPTYDEDWHNDVVCTDGIGVDRPYLRPDDDFITEDEIMESAREYEDALNAG